MTAIRNVKRAESCAFLGSPGSYSHAALRSMFPDCEAVSQPSFTEVVRSVQNRTCDLAVMPIENSISGRIPEPHQLLGKLDLAICSEQILPIKHCLVGRADLSAALAAKGEGYSIRSHRQGFLQCAEYLDEYFPRATLLPETDTATAVKIVSESGGAREIAIGSDYAAMLYGGKILSRQINDDADNYTRFVFLTHHENWTPVGDENLTFMSFKVGNQPNALSKALAVLGDNGINLVRLEMQGTSSKLAVPSFIVDAGIGVKDPAFMSAIKQFEGAVRSIKILGSCVASTERSGVTGFLPIN